MNKSRKKNVILNIGFGYIAQIGILLMSFIGRKIFLQYLSIDYLGINGLYSNILMILSLPELGLDSAVVYFLYKPVAQNKQESIASLMKYFKKLYFVLAIFIFIIGIAIVPFLKYIVKTDLAETELIIYYVLFLINTTVSYFAAHKVALLSANQEQRIQKLVMLGTNIFLQVLHIIILAIWRNYYLYLLGTILSTILNTIILTVLCNYRHPIKYISNLDEKVDRIAIKKKVYSTFTYKIGTVAINNTDNVLMSILVGVAAVGLYSNYHTIIAGVQGFLGIVTTSLISSIGNLGATKEKEKQYKVFNVMLLFYHFIAAMGGIGFYLLINDFVELWIGEKYLFDNFIVLSIAFNFYLSNAVNPIWMCREANGLFEKVKYLIIITALLNLVLSVILGKICGVAGILFATSISKILTMIWYEPKILFKYVFEKSTSVYWKSQFKYIIMTLIVFTLSKIIILPFETANNVMLFVIKAMVVAIVCCCVFFIGNYKTEEMDMIKSILRRKSKNVSIQK